MLNKPIQQTRIDPFMKRKQFLKNAFKQIDEYFLEIEKNKKFFGDIAGEIEYPGELNEY